MTRHHVFQLHTFNYKWESGVEKMPLSFRIFKFFFFEPEENLRLLGQGLCLKPFRNDLIHIHGFKYHLDADDSHFKIYATNYSPTLRILISNFPLRSSTWL